MPPAITPRKIPRHDRSLAAFVPVGPEGALLRLDQRDWRAVVVEALEVISNPHAKPCDVQRAVAEVVGLAETADTIRQEFFPR